jgi:hypothetical protein
VRCPLSPRRRTTPAQGSGGVTRAQEGRLSPRLRSSASEAVGALSALLRRSLFARRSWHRPRNGACAWRGYRPQSPARTTPSGADAPARNAKRTFRFARRELRPGPCGRAAERRLGPGARHRRRHHRAHKHQHPHSPERCRRARSRLRSRRRFRTEARAEMRSIVGAAIVRCEIEWRGQLRAAGPVCYLPDGTDIGAEITRRGLALDCRRWSFGRYRGLEVPGSATSSVKRRIARHDLFRCRSRRPIRSPTARLAGISNRLARTGRQGDKGAVTSAVKGTDR